MTSDSTLRLSKCLGAAVLVAFATWSLFGCASVAEKIIEKPKVRLADVGLRDVGAGGATVLFSVEVENPNPFVIRVDRLNYQIEIGGKSLAQGQLQDVARVRGHDKALVELPIAVKYSEIFASVMDLISNGTSAYRIKGDAAFGPLVIPFDQDGKLEFKTN